MNEWCAAEHAVHRSVTILGGLARRNRCTQPHKAQIYAYSPGLNTYFCVDTSSSAGVKA